MKPIFSRQEDIERIAFLNWRMSENDGIRNFLNMADGFLLSSIELAQQCVISNEGKRADILIFPILANANHGIELYLKALTWMVKEIMNPNSKVEGGHNIKQIYETLGARIKEYKGQVSVKDFEAATKDLSSYINELFQKIKATPEKDKMDFARYPFDKKDENHFYINEVGNVEIDLENFIIRFENIRQSLENLSDAIYYNELNPPEY